jgi:hypothetical protein
MLGLLMRLHTIALPVAVDLTRNASRKLPPFAMTFRTAIPARSQISGIVDKAAGPIPFVIAQRKVL